MKAQFYMDDLRIAVNAIKGFTGNDAAKPVLQYIKLSVNAATEQARAYATNGFIAAVETVPCNSDEDFDFMLRADALERLKGAEAVELAVENGDMVVSSEFVTVRYHAPDPYEFFDIEKFFPKDDPTFRIGFNAQYLMRMLKSCVDTKMNAETVLEFRGPLMPIILKTKSGSERLLLPMRIKGDIND